MLVDSEGQSPGLTGDTQPARGYNFQVARSHEDEVALTKLARRSLHCCVTYVDDELDIGSRPPKSSTSHSIRDRWRQPQAYPHSHSRVPSLHWFLQNC
jgi:hypothetical protein